MTLEIVVSLKLKLTNIYHYLDKQDIGSVYDRTSRNSETGEIFEMKKNLTHNEICTSNIPLTSQTRKPLRIFDGIHL